MGDQSGKRIAVLGYGLEAREHALRLRERGWNVRVVVRPGGTSWIRAMADGLRPVTVREAVAAADVVAVELPEVEQLALWAHSLSRLVAPGTLVVFAHGAALYSGALELDPRLDVVLITRGDASSGSRVAVHQDASGRALERAAAFAREVFDSAKVGTTTLAWEVNCELSELIDRMGGMTALLAEWDRVLSNPGHEPDEATIRYYEHLRAAVLADPAATVARRRGAA
jgi:ketol-acid reductoisomerase